MKARRIWGLLFFLLGAVVLTPALMCLFWPVQAAAMPGVLQRLGEGFLRDMLIRGFRVVQDYPRLIAVASGAVALLGLCLLLWPARKAPAMAVGSSWSALQAPRVSSHEAEKPMLEHERLQKKPLRFPYPEAWDVQNPKPALEMTKAIPPVERPAAPVDWQQEQAAEPITQLREEEPAPIETAKVHSFASSTASVACPSCGAMNSERAYFCRLCGADMPPVPQESQPAEEPPSAQPQKLHYVWENQPLPQVEAPAAPPTPILEPSPLTAMQESQPMPAPVLPPPVPQPMPPPAPVPLPLMEPQRVAAPVPPASLSPAPSLSAKDSVRIVSTVGRSAQKSTPNHLRPASFD